MIKDKNTENNKGINCCEEMKNCCSSNIEQCCSSENMSCCTSKQKEYICCACC